MRALSILILMFFTSSALASGKLTFEPRYNPETEQTTYTVGLGIYEPIITDWVALNSWTGFGDTMFDEAPDTDYSKWFVTKNSIDMFLTKSITVAPGLRLAYRPRDGEFNEDTVVSEVFAKLQIRLW